jgi:hypothetical protein
MVYGLGTRSYNRSTEARRNRESQKKATAEYQAQERVEIPVTPRCDCMCFRLPHELTAHKKLKSERDWESRNL